MRESHRLIINSAAVFCQTLVLMAIGLVLPPFVIHQLGNDRYGVVVVIGSILGFVALLQIGMPQALSRFIAVALERKDPQELSRVMSSGMAFLVVCGAIGMLAVALFVWAPELLVTWPAQMSRQTVQIVILIMGILTVLNMPLSFGHVSFVGRERFVLHAVLQTGGFLLRFGMVYGLLLAFPGSILAYAASSSGSVTLHTAIVFVLALCLFRDGRLSLGNVDLGILKKMLTFGSAVTLASMAVMLYIQADYFLIDKVVGPAAVTMFSLAVVWSLTLRNVLKAAVSVISPAAARTHVSGGQQALSMMLMRATKYSLLAAIAPLTFLCFYRYQLMDVWMGKGYDEAATLMLPILLADMVSHAVTGGTEMLVGMGRVRTILIIDLIGGVANIAVALLLSVWLGMGLMGFSLAYAVILVVRNAIVMPAYFMRVFHLKPLEYVGKCYGRSLLCAATMVPCVYLISRAIPGESWGRIFLAVAATMLAYLPLVALLGMDSYDRNVFRQLAGGIARKVRRI
ncbi:MAG: oligosaccharide flippase family protein [Phycisphaerae bacterium]|jgi:O-antigen/teichoic acid export membrane protein